MIGFRSKNEFNVSLQQPYIMGTFHKKSLISGLKYNLLALFKLILKFSPTLME